MRGIPKPQKVYILKKDIPDAIAGTKFHCRGSDYCYEKKANERDSQGFLDSPFVENNPDWFELEVVKDSAIWEEVFAAVSSNAQDYSELIKALNEMFEIRKKETAAVEESRAEKIYTLKTIL